MPDSRGGTAARRSGNVMTGLLTLGGLLMVRSLLGWLRSRRGSRPPRVDEQTVQMGHEPDGQHLVPAIIGGVAVIILVALSVGAATWIQAAHVARRFSLDAPPGLATPTAPPPPPEPRLEEVPGAQLRALRAAEDSILGSTAWVDRSAGIARIPIDRAIDLLAGRQLPARPPNEAGPTAADASGPPSDSSSGRMPAESTP